MAAATGVNANTVRAVYARLEAEGVVETEHGRGTFVSGATGGDGELAKIAQRPASEARPPGLDPVREAAAPLLDRDRAAESPRRGAARRGGQGPRREAAGRPP